MLVKINDEWAVDDSDPDVAKHAERGQLLLQLKPGTLQIRKWEIREL
jgi:hypothetical protein